MTIFSECTFLLKRVLKGFSTSHYCHGMAIDVLAEFVGLHAVNTIIVQNSAQRMKSSYKCMIRLMYWICGIIMFLKSNTYIYMWCASITVQSLYFTPDNSNPRNLSVPTLAAWFPWFLSCNFWQKKQQIFPTTFHFFYLLNLLSTPSTCIYSLIYSLFFLFCVRYWP